MQKVKNLVDNTILPMTDLYGSSPSLNLKGKDKTYTEVGFLFSLLVFAFGIWLLYYSSQDMIHKTNPQVSQLILDYEDPLVFDPAKNIFKFGILSTQTWQYINDPSYFTYRIYLYQLVPGGSGVQTDLGDANLVSCDPILHPGSLFCIEPLDPEGKPLVIGGSDGYSTLIIDFTKCQTSTSSCASDMDTVLDGAEIQFEDINYSVKDVNRYKNTIQRVQDYDDTTLSSSQRTNVVNHYQYITVNSQDGWILKSQTTQQVANKGSRIITSGAMRSDMPDVFLSVIYAGGGSHITYNRIYPQIQDVLGNVFGTLGTIILFLGYLALPYSSFRMKRTMVSNLYSVSIAKAALRNNGASKESAKVVDLESAQTVSESNSKKKLHVGFAQWILSSFTHQSEARAMEKAMEQIEQNIDMLSVIKLKREVSLLKKALLTENQRMLFDNIEEPEVVVNGAQDINIVDLIENHEGKSHEATKVFINLQESKNNSAVDQRIIALYKKEN